VVLFTSVTGAYNLFPEEKLPVIRRVWIYLRVYEPLHLRVLMKRTGRSLLKFSEKVCSVGIGAAVSLI
jgi:hypothetical protein